MKTFMEAIEADDNLKGSISKLKCVNNKYKLTDEIKEVDGYTLYRIKALKDFGDVKAGDLGGFIQSENNLDFEGNCWIYDNACVYESACVSCNAKVTGDVRVRSSAKIIDNASIGGTATITDAVCIQDNAQVHVNVKIDGVLTIGGNAYIVDDSQVKTLRYLIEDYGTSQKLKVLDDNCTELNCSSACNIKDVEALNRLIVFKDIEKTIINNIDNTMDADEIENIVRLMHIGDWSIEYSKILHIINITDEAEYYAYLVLRYLNLLDDIKPVVGYAYTNDVFLNVSRMVSNVDDLKILKSEKSQLKYVLLSALVLSGWCISDFLNDCGIYNTKDKLKDIVECLFCGISMEGSTLIEWVESYKNINLSFKKFWIMRGLIKLEDRIKIKKPDKLWLVNVDDLLNS